MTRLAVLLIVLAPVMAGASFGAAPAVVPGAKLKVAVSILPQAYFVERVGGNLVEVEVLVGPGQSPHVYEPTPRQLTSLARAKVYFAIGIDFEAPLLPRLQRMFKNLRIVDTRAGVPLRYMSAGERAAEAAHGHDHGHGEAGGGHEHSEPACAGHAHDPPGAPTSQPGGAPAGLPDPHTWLNPLYAKIQAETICRTLAEIDPAHAEQFRRNLAAFQADLDRVDAELRQALAPLRGKEVFVFHPAFGYFTDAYGLKQTPVEMEGKEPSARQLAGLIERARAAGVKVIFTQPQMPTRSAEAVARAIGGAVVPLDDLPRDYLKNFEDMAAKLKAALGPAADGKRELP